MRTELIAVCLLALRTALGVTVTFHGGAGRVGGSCATVRAGAFQALVDCGTAYGPNVAATNAPDRQEGTACGFPFDPKAYDHLLLTHAHQDHAGRVPELFNAGFTGTVWVTEATRELLAVAWKSQVLYDPCTVRNWRWTRHGKKPGIRMHWRRECEWSQKISQWNLGSYQGVFADLQRHLRMTPLASHYAVACRICQDLELEALLKHVKTVPFNTPQAIGPFTVTFSAVKHLPGAAAIRFADANSSVLFSGDLGTLRSHLVKTLDPAPKADAVFIESTYGDTSHGTPEETERDYARFADVVGATVRKAGVAWIPSFALDRSQRVLLEVMRGMAKGTIPTNTPVYYLSPSARDFAELYVSHPAWFDVPEEMQALGALFHRTRKSFSPQAKLKHGAILLTTSGTMDTGFSLKYVPDLLPRETTSICLVGYQSPGTCGRQLQKIARGTSTNTTVRVRDGRQTREIPVKASVYDFGCFSGHGDARENDAWLANNRNARILLVHGDEAALRARAEGLRTRGIGRSVEIVEPERVYVFDNTESRTDK